MQLACEIGLTADLNCETCVQSRDFYRTVLEVFNAIRIIDLKVVRICPLELGKTVKYCGQYKYGPLFLEFVNQRYLTLIGYNHWFKTSCIAQYFEGPHVILFS